MEMRKVLIAALALAGGGVFAQPTFAKSFCKQQRDECYAAIGRMADRGAADACDAEYGRCINARSRLQASHPMVSPVPGLGVPMVKPYPTGAVPVNFAETALAGQTSNAKSSRFKKPPPPPSGTTGSSSQGGSSTSGGSSSSGSSSSSGKSSS